MKEKLAFCEKCRNDVKFVTEEKEMVGTIHGKQYHYVGLEAKCANCGAYVDVEEIGESNLKALYDVYRKENGIVSLEKIRTIPERYGIGKRPLSILLGWGEHTFSRYLDGEIPTKQYSEILNRLYDEPTYFLKVLEENKECLGSKHTYEKSHKAVDKYISDNITSGQKINVVIAYLLNQCEDITPLALQKILYYVQGFYYAFYGEFIFIDDCEAWAHGPVYRNVYTRYADYHFDPISRIELFDSSVFTAQEKAILDNVIKYICCYSGKILETFTHNETPWINTRGNLQEGVSSNKTINKQLIAEYFVKIKEKYNMNTPRDIKAYTKDMFENL